MSYRGPETSGGTTAREHLSLPNAPAMSTSNSPSSVPAGSWRLPERQPRPITGPCRRFKSRSLSSPENARRTDCPMPATIIWPGCGRGRRRPTAVIKAPAARPESPAHQRRRSRWGGAHTPARGLLRLHTERRLEFDAATLAAHRHEVLPWRDGEDQSEHGVVLVLQ